MVDLCGREMENCTEAEGGRVLDPEMLDLCGREMTEQDFQEVEQYRLVSCHLQEDKKCTKVRVCCPKMSRLQFAVLAPI